MDYYIDLGSSTIKIYQFDGHLTLLEEHSIYFKNDFDAEKGLSEENKKELLAYFKECQEKYGFVYTNTHIYVTGIFRNLIEERKKELVRLFNDEFDLHFNIISHGLENYYLARAMEHPYNDKKVLIINMGGKTTELVTFDKGKINDTKNLNVGVADILNNFRNINTSLSEEKIEDIEKYIENLITDSIDDNYDCAIFTGGEERFEKLTNFNLVPNTLFDDGVHQYMCSLEDYIEGTNRVFYTITMDELYQLMPQNPKWMDGARAGAIIPLVLFKKGNVSWVIPSDLNLINGVIKDKKI